MSASLAPILEVKELSARYGSVEALHAVTMAVEDGEFLTDHPVLAIGAPYGLEQTATSGIVSAKGRSLPGDAVVPFIQTDAAVNPGNSGGPLVNSTGEVVGIVTGLMNPTGQRVFVGIGFAVPIENAAMAVGLPPF